MKDEQPASVRSLCMIFMCVWLLVCTQDVFAEDTIWLRSDGASDRVYARKDTIKDYTGESLTLASGTRIPAARVLRIDSKWSESHVAADEALARGEFAKALAAYQQAVGEEPRRWVRRMLLARMADCHRGQGRLDLAAAAFLALTKADPSTQAFDAIPLVWHTSPQIRIDATVSRQRLTSPNPVERLIGASHLVATPSRGAALEVLEALSILPDTRFAILAQAQLWRTRIATAKPYELEQWVAAVEKLPEPLRAGPSFVVAGAFAQQKQPRRAAELYMRVPILHRKQYDLAAQSLWEAAAAFAKLQRPKDVDRCLREIVKDFAHSPLAETAQNQLQAAAPAN